MTDKTDKEPLVSKLPPIAIGASDNAPFVYFEHATNFGHVNGVIQITLDAMRYLAISENEIRAERVTVAHLRMSIPSAQSLKAAIESAIFLANPAASGRKN